MLVRFDLPENLTTKQAAELIADSLPHWARNLEKDYDMLPEHWGLKQAIKEG